MARPPKHNADYFPHDNNMRNDKKIKAARARFNNLDGYAVYNMLLEVLTEADLLCIKWTDMEIEMLAGDFGIESERLKQIVDYCLVINLVQVKNGWLFCRQLDRRLAYLFEKRKDDIHSLRVKNGINVAETIVTAEETPRKPGLPSRESKEKGSKEKGSKVKKSEAQLSEENPGPNSPQEFDPFSFCPPFITEKDWGDIVQHRRAKGVLETKRSYESLTEELHKAFNAGYSIKQCVDVMTNRDWKGFMFDWMKNIEIEYADLGEIMDQVRPGRVFVFQGQEHMIEEGNVVRFEDGTWPAGTITNLIRQGKAFIKKGENQKHI